VRAATVRAAVDGPLTVICIGRAALAEFVLGEAHYNEVAVAAARVHRQAELAAEAEGGTGPGGQLLLSAEVARAVVVAHDPATPPEEIERVVASGLLGAQAARELLAGGGALPPEGAAVAVTDFAKNLRGICVPRHGPPPGPEVEPTAEQQADRFVRSLSDAELQKIKAGFEHMDQDFSGSLSKKEVAELLRTTYGIEPTPKQLAALVAEVDTSGDGYIDMDEFIAAMGTSEALQHAGEVFKWRTSFSSFDADGSGFLDRAELLAMATELFGGGSMEGPQVQEQIEKMVASVDANGDGQVSWEEFLIMMAPGMTATGI
jgi:calcium-binding protein CML